MSFRVPLMRPVLTPAVRASLDRVLESGMWTEGAMTGELEARIAAYVGVEHAIAVTSCTTGLELVLRALGIGPGDEVVVPDYTYPASALAVQTLGATAVLVDVCPEHLVVQPETLEAAIGPKTRALMPVSLFGNPLESERIDAIAEAHGIPVVEDAACALGAARGGRRVGGFGRAAVFSLHPRKFITSGEGGIITTNDDALAASLRSRKRFGMAPDETGAMRFAGPGTNLKLSDLQSAVAVGQLEDVDGLLERRLLLAERYEKWLAAVPGVALSKTTAGGIHSRQSFVVRVAERDRVFAEMRERGIEVQIGTYALHREPAFAPGERTRTVGSLAGSLRAYDEALTLPLFDGLSEADQRLVVDTLAEVVRA